MTHIPDGEDAVPPASSPMTHILLGAHPRDDARTQNTWPMLKCVRPPSLPKP